MSVPPWSEYTSKLILLLSEGGDPNGGSILLRLEGLRFDPELGIGYSRCSTLDYWRGYVPQQLPWWVVNWKVPTVGAIVATYELVIRPEYSQLHEYRVSRTQKPFKSLLTASPWRLRMLLSFGWPVRVPRISQSHLFSFGICKPELRWLNFDTDNYNAGYAFRRLLYYQILRLSIRNQQRHKTGFRRSDMVVDRIIRSTFNFCIDLLTLMGSPSSSQYANRPPHIHGCHRGSDFISYRRKEGSRFLRLLTKSPFLV